VIISNLVPQDNTFLYDSVGWLLATFAMLIPERLFSAALNLTKIDCFGTGTRSSPFQENSGFDQSCRLMSLPPSEPINTPFGRAISGHEIHPTEYRPVCRFPDLINLSNFEIKTGNAFRKP
jgi:hypothetical protein